MDRQRADRGLERLGLEPVVGQLLHRHRQAADHAEQVLASEPAQFERERGERQALAEDVGAGHARHRRAVSGVEEVRGRVHEADELGPARGIARRQPANRVERAGVVGRGRQSQRSAIGQQGDVRRSGGFHRAQAVACQIEVADDIGSQSAARMQRRGLEARPEQARRELAAGRRPRSSTRTFRPALARYAAATSPLCPAPTIRMSGFVMPRPIASP